MAIDSITNKRKILRNFLDLCVMDGWNDNTLTKSVEISGFNPNLTSLIFENKALDMANFFISANNEELFLRLQKLSLEGMGISQKVKNILKIRLEIEEANKKQISRLIEFYSSKNFFNSMTLAYKLSDQIWHFIGDKSTDFNFYSKRIILSKIIIRTLIFFINDQSINHKKTWDLLDRQIDRVNKIGKLKSFAKNGLNKSSNFVRKLSNHETCDLKDIFHKLPFIRLFK